MNEIAANSATAIALKSVPTRRRVALWMDEADAEAFLTILLQAPETAAVPGAVADRLICRVADVHREFSRPTPVPRRRPRATTTARRYRVLSTIASV